VVLGLSAVTRHRLAVADLLVCGSETEFMSLAVGIIGASAFGLTIVTLLACVVDTALAFGTIGVRATFVFVALVVGYLTAVARDRDALLIGAHLIVRAVIVSRALRRLFALGAAYQTVELRGGLVAFGRSDDLDIHSASWEGIRLTLIRVSGEYRRQAQRKYCNRSLVIPFETGNRDHIAFTATVIAVAITIPH
jgi:hypothetical protein